MKYEPPALQYQGALGELLGRLLPSPGKVRSAMDWRVRSLLLDIDSQTAIVEWNLQDACRRLKLDISAAHAARLFKHCTGLGVMGYEKKKRLLIAAERLRATECPVKTIAAECGYRKPGDFSRRFKEEYHLSPTTFRKKTA